MAFVAKWKKQTWTVDHDDPDGRNGDNHYANTQEYSTAELQSSSENKPRYVHSISV